MGRVERGWIGCALLGRDEARAAWLLVLVDVSKHLWILKPVGVIWVSRHFARDGKVLPNKRRTGPGPGKEKGLQKKINENSLKNK